MIKSIKRIGKAKLRFRFDVVVHSASLVPKTKWRPVPLAVTWRRGPRTASTPAAPFVANSGIVEWQTSLCMLATLYKSPEAPVADAKLYRLSLLAVDASAGAGKKPRTKTLATTSVDFGEYATVTAKPVTKTLALKIKSKKLASASLTVTITSVCLDDAGSGPAAHGAGSDSESDSDSMSMSAVSEISGCSSDDEEDSAPPPALSFSAAATPPPPSTTSQPLAHPTSLRASPPRQRRSPSLRGSRQTDASVASPAEATAAPVSVPVGPGAVPGGAGGASEVRYLQKMLQQQLTDAWKEKQRQEETIEELQMEVAEKATIILQYKSQLDEADDRIAELEAESRLNASLEAASGSGASSSGATRDELLALLEDSTAKVAALKAKNKARKIEITSLESRLVAAEAALERASTAAAAPATPPPARERALSAYSLAALSPDGATLRTPGGRTLSVGLQDEVPGYGRVIKLDVEGRRVVTASGRAILATDGSELPTAAAAAAATPSPSLRTPGTLAERRELRQLTDDYNEMCERLTESQRRNELLADEVGALQRLVDLYAPDDVRAPKTVAPGTECDDLSLSEDGVRIRALETMLELAVSDAELAKHERELLETEFVSTKLKLAQTEFEKEAAQKDVRSLERKYAKSREVQRALSEKMTRMEVELATSQATRKGKGKTRGK
ncbi:uncharacterized protein AMSG_03425 [Thecamonas trahens ATCC 50062]|uniref:C2 NT-type domain-containing protein n=1 Tax=Thecamonas trahens ATCC 50062 TaxID=461836 RepID=A0A0L0D3T0_THETB|nr:hypothetical protein AMSG_03425 [Thecamonas trahens ATCC 50062]KNC47002.1 hypothetical protein AMSG_03425 [Thecamonas trahens ATCC 50062]|eukprot:XP_013759785.1 hypothetical protein AMSG_03425 [Thecamonas trahens ATCC 50062]